MPEWLAETMPDDPLMALAWRDCLSWAVGEPEILGAFQRETGTAYAAPRTPLDRMIDKATGVEEHVARAFVKWFNANVWGEDSPDASTDTTRSTSVVELPDGE
jgi:hypothetical protein